MSYKSIDVQVSLPRALEMSPLQHQQQMRSATEQTMLGQQAVKQAEQEAKRSAKPESTSNDTVSEKQPRNRGDGQQQPRRKQAQEQLSEDNAVSEHPYKGKHIDFSG